MVLIIIITQSREVHGTKRKHRGVLTIETLVIDKKKTFITADSENDLFRSKKYSSIDIIIVQSIERPAGPRGIIQ